MTGRIDAHRPRARRGGRRRGRSTVTLLVLAGLLGALARPARAQAPGEPSALWPRDCDRACLIGIARRYMDALVHHDPSRAPFAVRARFTENDVPMTIGRDGLWGTINAASSTALTAADTETGNVAWFGTVEEHGSPAYYAMRLQIRARRITEVETVIERKPGLPAAFGDPTKLIHDPAFADVLAPRERRGRERLRDVANGYFSTIARNDGDLFTQFDPDCERLENGISTTSGRFGSAGSAQGCEAQFRLGLFRINKRVRERRFPIIDEERGVVVATGFFDHDNSFDQYRTTDGKLHETLLKWPNSLSLMEAFKIRNGRIYRVEAVYTYVPYFMSSPWLEPQTPAVEADVPAAPSHLDCDRACLIRIAEEYMRALVAHDPRSLPWAVRVRYTENSVPMMIGDGQWGSVDWASPSPLHAADPATGNVAWVGVVREHGQAAYYAMRVKVENRRISEVEAVIDGKGEPGPFGDPDKAVHDPAFQEVLTPDERVPRERLIALANGYFSTLQRNDGTIHTRFDPQCGRTENGISTTFGHFGSAAIAQGCEAQFKLGLYRYDDAVRARRYELVDVERGVVVATGYIDHSARITEFKRTDGKLRTAPYLSPNSLGFMEVFKIRKGRVYRVESVFCELPYLMRSPWLLSSQAWTAHVRPEGGAEP
ncbi:MAG TPA: hypothetical protein VMU67_02360 [Steroidobacteraceae bacterium]|nr:hypothetical protein [Steroidobacteraceae bacterium]